MGAAMRRFAALDAVDWTFIALVVVAPCMHDIDESVRFAMFRAMRRFFTLTTINRLFLSGATILAISHIIFKDRHACALNHVTSHIILPIGF
jgi:hypothetical protein